MKKMIFGAALLISASGMANAAEAQSRSAAVTTAVQPVAEGAGIPLPPVVRTAKGANGLQAVRSGRTAMPTLFREAVPAEVPRGPIAVARPAKNPATHRAPGTRLPGRAD